MYVLILACAEGGYILDKKFSLLLLALFIFISSIPSPSYGRGQVMEIDAVFPNYRLRIENEYMSHKEVFIYDGELWVPMKEIAKALDLGYAFDSGSRTLKLNSHGRLNIKDNSLEPIAYQRGYEIQAKVRRIAQLDKEIREFEGRRTSSPSEREGLVRNIKVGFSDIDVILDGKKIFLDRDPLLYKDDVYISLVALSPILYITPELEGNIVNIDGNAILVEKPGHESIEKLVSFREALNDRLGRELAELEKKKKILMDVKIPYEEVGNLKDMEKYLNRHLGYIGELPVGISLRLGGDSWYYLDIEFETRSISGWKKLTRRDIEAYIWDIFVAITSLYDEEAKIQGQIRNPYRPRYNYVEFNTHMRNIVFKFLDSGLDMTEKVDPQFIEDLLREKLGRYNREYFDYSARISGYDLELIVYPNTRTFTDNWSIHAKLSYLKEINYLIREYYPELRINGIVDYPGRDSIQFLIDNGKVRSPDLERETEKFLNDRYGLFKSGTFSIPMEYKLHSTNLDDYKLLIYMDFDINDDRWNRAMEDELGAFLQDIVSEIIALWDMNIFLQAYDRNQALVKEVVISQDIVQMVNADPVSGEIVEGSTVTLYTNTADATIYYTLDGSAPSPSNRILYTGPIVINKDTIIRAYATKTGMKDSPIATFEYTVVEDGNMASGLDGLTVLNGRLEPDFDRRVYDYEVDLDYLVDTLSLIPTAPTGSIKINGEYVESGERVDVELDIGRNKITIVHEEEDKRDRIYTLIVNRKDVDAPRVWLAPGYTFKTQLAIIFEGRLTSDTIQTFNGYKISLLSKLGKRYRTVEVRPDGSFKITIPHGEVDIIDKIIGFKYKIIDPRGIILPEDEDGNILEPR